jgi:hypothetical protein
VQGTPEFQTTQEERPRGQGAGAPLILFLRVHEFLVMPLIICSRLRRENKLLWSHVNLASLSDHYKMLICYKFPRFLENCLVLPIQHNFRVCSMWRGRDVNFTRIRQRVIERRYRKVYLERQRRDQIAVVFDDHAIEYKRVGTYRMREYLCMARRINRPIGSLNFADG